MTTGTAGINGIPFYYELAGEGHPLVLVHAGIADQRMWDEQFARFVERYRVLRYDLRGFGRTPMPPGEFYHHEDLHALLAFLGIPSAYLLGISKGGSIALDFTLAYPQQVDALVLANSAPVGYRAEGEPPVQWEAMSAAFKAGNFERAAELEVQIWVDGRFRGPDEVDPSIRDRIRAMDVIALKNEASGVGEELPLEPYAAGRLGEVHAPTLVINGDLDQPDFVAAGAEMARQIAGARRVVIPGTAHFPNLEQPEAFNRAVLEFLAEVESMAEG